ncbi:MAG TPA: MogA/MoaB family molybdenum cofactor biosynthesis protein [Bryobacteraceae bacterium]|nr:MogA/MoaB family molybdenum cofactor biosynthesis protein [Bryobacteraceae bacterium]
MMTVAILTISDSAHQGKRVDESGPALERRCQELNWKVVAAAVCADDKLAISKQLSEWIDSAAASLILTSGGTGISERDNTPEATRAVLDRELPGVSELIRARGVAQTPFSVLSRGLAGTSRRSFVVNLPGSPKGALYSLNAIEQLIPHIVDLLSGKTEH